MRLDQCSLSHWMTGITNEFGHMTKSVFIYPTFKFSGEWSCTIDLQVMGLTSYYLLYSAIKSVEGFDTKSYIRQPNFTYNSHSFERKFESFEPEGTSKHGSRVGYEISKTIDVFLTNLGFFRYHLPIQMFRSISYILVTSKPCKTSANIYQHPYGHLARSIEVNLHLG